jgi:hypothetical protein
LCAKALRIEKPTGAGDKQWRREGGEEVREVSSSTSCKLLETTFYTSRMEGFSWELR